jgi:hypothetical protein
MFSARFECAKFLTPQEMNLLIGKFWQQQTIDHQVSSERNSSMAHPVVQCEKADCIIATGVSNSLEDFVRPPLPKWDWIGAITQCFPTLCLGQPISRTVMLMRAKQSDYQAGRRKHVKDAIAMMAKAELEDPERRRAAEAVSHNS